MKGRINDQSENFKWAGRAPLLWSPKRGTVIPIWELGGGLLSPCT